MIPKTLPPAADATENTLITEAKHHYEAATVALRKGCEHALMAGLRLMWLHSNTVSMGGDRRPSSLPHVKLPKGFTVAVAEIGMPERTAYRWMDATWRACLRATLIFEDDDIRAELPAPGSPRWESWEKSLQEIAKGMSMNRLMLGTMKASTEDHRYEELIGADEAGRARATKLLQGVAEGKYTLVQAVRALGSLEAYDRLRADGGEKVRRDPVYLSMDGETGALGGLYVTALKTLQNTFSRWEETPEAARAQARELWLHTVAALPDELRKSK